VRPRFEGLVDVNDVTPLPTVIPPVLTANERRGTVAPLLELFLRLLSAIFADEALLPGPSFHEKLSIEVEKDEWRLRAACNAPDKDGGRDEEVGVSVGDRR
jgi:hypothetical protein